MSKSLKFFTGILLIFFLHICNEGRSIPNNSSSAEIPKDSSKSPSRLQQLILAASKEAEESKRPSDDKQQGTDPLTAASGALTEMEIERRRALAKIVQGFLDLSNVNANSTAISSDSNSRPRSLLRLIDQIMLEAAAWVDVFFKNNPKIAENPEKSRPILKYLARVMFYLQYIKEELSNANSDP
jgi:hypothetical protein